MDATGAMSRADVDIERGGSSTTRGTASSASVQKMLDGNPFRASASSGRARTRAEPRASSLAERLCETQFGVMYDKLDGSVWEQGEFLLEVCWHAFALSAWATSEARSISVCGYLEIVPNALAWMYFLTIAGCVVSAFWSALASARAETRRALKLGRFVVACAPACALVGLSIYPRCMWHPHQDFVLAWANLAAFAMMFEFVVDSKFFAERFRRGERVVTSDVALPQLAFIIGYLITLKFYQDNGTNFFRGEIMGSGSYGWWVLSKHRAGTFAHQPNARVYTWREMFLVDGCFAVAMMCVFRFNEYHQCSSFGQFR